MALIDFLLNLAGLLIWLHWRSLRHDPLARATAASLAGTLKRTEPRGARDWQILGGLVGLILLRSWLYWQIGSAAGANPRLDLGVIAITFRSDVLGLVWLYSCLSFGKTLLIFYTWLVVLSVLNRHAADPDPIQKLIRLHLGRVWYWPWPALLLLPMLVTAVGWMAIHPLLVKAGTVTRAGSVGHLAEQGLLVGGALYLTLKYLLPIVLFMDLILNYVFLGTSPLWDFIGATSRQLLAPLRWLPLRLARLDFAPLVGAVVILLLLDATPKYLLARFPDLPLTLWPQ